EAPGTNRIDVFLDDGAEPIASYSPPLRFELDTTRLPDGPHTLRVEAYDSFGTKGVKVVRFTVRNGPGIVVSGLRQDDVLEGTVPVLVNSYGGAVESKWEPSRAETPSPVPTWAWVLVIMLVAYGLYYGVQHWNPPPDVAAFSGQTAAAAPAPTAGAPAASRAGADRPGAGTPPGGGAGRGGRRAEPRRRLPPRRRAPSGRRRGRAGGGPVRGGGLRRRVGRERVRHDLRQLPPGRRTGPARRLPADSGRPGRDRRGPRRAHHDRPRRPAGQGDRRRGVRLAHAGVRRAARRRAGRGRHQLPAHELRQRRSPRLARGGRGATLTGRNAARRPSSARPSRWLRAAGRAIPTSGSTREPGVNPVEHAV